MSVMNAKSWEILGRTERQLKITQTRLENTETKLKEVFAIEITRLEKIIDDLRNQ